MYTNEINIYLLITNHKLLQVEFLLRYENQGGLFWESEEYIRRMCPTLLKVYEKNRERRQQRLVSLFLIKCFNLNK